MARPRNFDPEEILQKAMELFWAKGYHATSIHDLVQHLNINRASLYTHWKNKHQLYIESLYLYRRQSSAELLSLVRSQRSALEIIEDFLSQALHTNQPHLNGCFLVNATTELATKDKQVASLISENKATITKVLSAIIEAAKEENEIKSTLSSHDLAHYLFSVYTGLCVMRQSQMELISLQTSIAFALSILENDR